MIWRPALWRLLTTFLLGAQMLGAPLLVASPAQAQEAVAPGLVAAQIFIDRMVRVTGRQAVGGQGLTAYGFIIGTHPAADGRPGILIATPDHLLRDPLSPDAKFAPPSVTFYADLSRSIPAELLPEHLSPTEGDLALLVVGGTITQPFREIGMADVTTLASGNPVWQTGRSGNWLPSPQPGHYALREAGGLLDFDGLEATADTAGSAVLANLGLAGMVVGGRPGGARVLSADVIADKLKSWGMEWAFKPSFRGVTQRQSSLAAMTAPTGAGTIGLGSAMPTPVGLGSAAGNAPVKPLQFDRMTVISLSAADLAARGNWSPPGARLSPWPRGSAGLYAAPSRDALRIGALPAGSHLPKVLWDAGAYRVDQRLDNGAWFLVGSDNTQLGYVSGSDVVELWPALPAGTPPTGRVLRDWVVAGGHALLRDAGTYYDLSYPLLCARASCGLIQIGTPTPPAAGAAIPTWHVLPIEGNWKQDEVVPVHLQLPRNLVETKGVRVIACIGLAPLPGIEAECTPEALLPAGG